MSKVDELIAEHCPGGVEFIEIGALVERAPNIKWEEQDGEESEYVDLSSVDRRTNRITETMTIDRDSAPSRAQQIIRSGDVLFGTTRPMLKRCCTVGEDYDGQIASTGFCVLRPTHRISTKWLYHLLGTPEFYEHVETNQRGASYPAISDALVKEFRIPVPPLAIQREITSILDKMESLKVELEVELEVELDLRSCQYAFYRDQLLTFPEAGCRWSTLGDICTRVFSGGTPLATRAEYYGGDIPWLRTQEVDYGEVRETAVHITETGLANSSAKWVRANSVIVAISGAGVTRGRAAINKIALTTNQHCCNLEPDESQVNNRFVYYWLVHNYRELRSRGNGNRSDLNVGIIKGYPIPVPSFGEQERIVAILDKFDALVNDLSTGLPAEISARRQQYEYYRDRLLTFNEAVA